MASKLNELPQNASVFFIGRYSFDIDTLRNSGLLSCQYNNISGFIDVKYPQRSDLKMCFMTAHKSKGLQADYVFIINNKNSRMGFPSRMQDDPILDLLLENKESYPFAEERRLFYVALTRAKTKTYLLLQKNHESTFAQELHTRYESQIKHEQFECPICGGHLSRKTGPYGDFYGCDNYKSTGCKFVRRIKSK
ncbi:MAG: topoisomerase DNA-binding C4 zinc finger domain-containing protein [Clostridia bacterium]|nr:topoisomerase DNA-binding C4 zinc finger domain-containing protein [Clostridia bacterium]